ncbi:Rossmann-like and DUF2520 domain-containing protein [Pedobacter metabolipauper]|uniref:Putative short-subunit dehydrogenase-like oxidoreductase (DUF2520 family) n=1 Tax=Pedobacter metabolipauper TaxID=425513 RepID=A0A4R6SVY2_9SPHI|nr:Rossmann-like and DUF2520 domain-containing protein [Pedobacter metabolipauper]TDQ08531.1 putative short-subunit dehydrogenase-like oxidoreductase (DUF2520 family) [Pedobacter metabolipauper]
MKIVCIGSGNVATHIAQAFTIAGASIVQVWSKQIQHAALLANTVDAAAITDPGAIDQSADLYIIAVKDDAILEMVQALKSVKGLVVHTSGSTPIEVLSPLSSYGVLYPLQTFSKVKELDFKKIPLCIEAKDHDTLEALKNIASRLSPLVYIVNSDKRKILHLAAVFACNFVNHLYTLSEQILKDNALDFDMLRPLIMETAEKVQAELPGHVQTGPAVRKDEQTIERHLGLLQAMPQTKEIYQTLSESIKKTHQ